MANAQSYLERYHHYQTSFVQWLGVAARQCGFIFSQSPIRRQSGNRSRQKRGKPSQSVVKHLVTALELIEQATFLKDSGRREAVTPGGIRRCLRKTINLRESHSHLWSQSSTNHDDWARHEAFIQVLKTCYDLLTRFPSKSSSLENETNDDQVQKDLIRYNIASSGAIAGFRGSFNAITDSSAATVSNLSELTILRATTNLALDPMKLALQQILEAFRNSLSSDPRQSQRTTASLATASFMIYTILRIDC